MEVNDESLYGVRDLGKRCLLRHLMLHSDESSFIDFWLGILVQAILTIISYGKIDVHLEVFVDLLSCPEAYSRL